MSPPATAPRKRQRVGSSTTTRLSSSSSSPLPAAVPGGFNDAATADLLLTLRSPSSASSLDLHLHSSALRRSPYFAALLSDRWNSAAAAPPSRLTHTTPHPLPAYAAVLRLLYTPDLSASILTVADALDLLPIAAELLFEDCVKACLRFLEAVPWTPSEEDAVLAVLPFIQREECHDILARLTPAADLPEEMLFTLIVNAVHAHPKIVTNKVVVANLLKEYIDRGVVQRVLDRAFVMKLESVKETIGEYASPVFRMGDQDEMEAIQRLNLHTAVLNSRHLLWLVERMIELRVAGNAVREWSEQKGLAADLNKIFSDDTWRNVTPGLPALVMKCTSLLASAVAAGSILAPQQVRKKLVKDWLPVLIACRDIVSSISCHKSPYQELEEAFLAIISTLPMSDSKELLLQCLPLSTRNVDDCPHLISAYNTWFRRANRPLPETSAELKPEPM